MQLASLEAVFRPPKTLRPLRDQPVAVLVEIGQGEGRQMPVVILQDAAIAHLDITEDTLQNSKGPLDLGAHTRLSPVLAFLLFIYALLGLHAPIGMSCALGAAS